MVKPPPAVKWHIITKRKGGELPWSVQIHSELAPSINSSRMLLRSECLSMVATLRQIQSQLPRKELVSLKVKEWKSLSLILQVDINKNLNFLMK